MLSIISTVFLCTAMSSPVKQVKDGHYEIRTPSNCISLTIQSTAETSRPPCECSFTCKETYIEKTMRLIEEQPLNLTQESKLQNKRILENIYDNIGSDRNKLALFTASALHNTGYFKVFKANSGEKYCSRGLLMITYDYNYKKLSDLSGYDYLTRPDELEYTSSTAIKSTVLFFFDIMKYKEYTFQNMMEALCPQEQQHYAATGVKNEAYINREALYDKLLR